MAAPGPDRKEPRYYHWAWLDQATTDADPDGGDRHSLLIRRNASTGQVAFYRCWTPQPATLASGWPGSAGPPRKPSKPPKARSAWTSTKSAAGTLGTGSPPWPLAALAVLAICAADELPQSGLIKLTVNEVRRLINAFIIRPIHELAHRLRWSQWRRRHEGRVRRAHYKRRLNAELQPWSRTAAAVLVPAGRRT